MDVCMLIHVPTFRLFIEKTNTNVGERKLAGHVPNTNQCS